MRLEAAPAEAIVWYLLRNRRLGGFKFRRQHAVDRYVADFYCVDAKLIVELDGDSHFDRVVHDQVRSTRLAELNFSVLRFSNVDVFENIEGVLESILSVCESRKSPHPSPLPRVQGRGDKRLTSQTS